VKLGRILACGLAQIGAYFLVLRLAWMIRIDDDWLPYAAQAAGALIAGAVIVRQGRGARFEPAAGAFVGVAIVALISAVSPHTFSWVATRSDAPWPIGLAIMAGSLVLAEVGARLSRQHADEGGGLGAVLILGTAVNSCSIHLGGRIFQTLLDREVGMAVIIGTICVEGVLAAFLVQWVVPRTRIVACASGTAIVMLWQVVEMVRGPFGIRITPEVLYVLFPITTALFGSYTAVQTKPHVVDRTLEAFD